MQDALIKAYNIWPQQVEYHSASAINIDIYPDTIYGFIGPDSSLVSSWLQTLAAIEPPAIGNVQFMDINTINNDRDNWKKLRTNLAYLNHHSTLLSVLSTQENILLPALYHQLANRECLLDEMITLLKKIGFKDMSNLSKLPAYLDELSYCQAMLVRMVITKPTVIIIDNTLRHFDERTSRNILGFLKDYVASAHAALLLHDDNAEFILTNASKIIYVDANSLLQFNNRKEFQSSDNHQVKNYLIDLATH